MLRLGFMVATIYLEYSQSLLAQQIKIS